MMEMRLIRLANRDDGTFGVLLAGDLPFALTLERPWRDNRRGESCIPAGRYACRRVQSPKFGDTFEVTQVPGRSHILFHRGNTFRDSHGCILVGEQFTVLEDDRAAIASSAVGFAEFLALTHGLNGFGLDVLAPPFFGISV